MLSLKWNGNALSDSGVSVISYVTEEPSSETSTSLCSTMRARPWRGISQVPAADVAVLLRSEPTMGNRMGACLPQKAGSPCHRYSLPLRARLVSWAPMESMAAVRLPRLMVVTVDMLLPPKVNNSVDGYCPTLGGGVERQAQLLSNSVKVKPALRSAIDRIGRLRVKAHGNHAL